MNYINPDYNLIEFEINTSTFVSDEVDELIYKLKTLDYVRNIVQVDSEKLNFSFTDVDQVLPNTIENFLKNEISNFNVSLNVNIRTIQNVFKEGTYYSQNLFLSGVNSLEEATLLENRLLVNQQVLFVDFNVETHNLFIITSINLTQEFFLYLINSTGKKIINSEFEFSKYY